MPHHRIEYGHLTTAQRIQLMQELWDSLDPCAPDAPLTDAQKNELDRRLDELEQNPAGAREWKTVYEELTRRLAQRRAAAALSEIAERGGIRGSTIQSRGSGRFAETGHFLGASKSECMTPEMLHLTATERLELAQELIDSVDPLDPETAVTPAQLIELDRRWLAHQADPEAGEPWESVLEEVLRELADEQRGSTIL